MKRAVGLIIGIVVSVICFAYSMKGTSLEELKAGFLQANYLSLPFMLAMLFGFYWLKALRWSWLLSPVTPLTTRQLFPPLLIGFAANNILPAHLGEFVRVFVVRKQHKVPFSTVFSTVVLERIFDVVAILGLFSVGLMFTKDLPDDYRKSAIFLAAGCVFVVICVAFYLIWTDWFLKLTETIIGWVPFIPKSLTGKILDMLRAGAHGLAALRSGRTVFLIMLNSIVQWLLNGLLAYTALRAFHVPVTPTAGLIVTGVIAIGVTIPSSPGYFGVIQYCFAISMAAQGLDIDPSLVLGASLYYHISMYIPVTVLGLHYLHSLGMRVSDLNKVADDPVDQDSPGQTLNTEQEENSAVMPQQDPSLDSP
ncbi:MAG: lysylphosphatidylglycerol synthase transmembrane domain-containing protein [Fuerstiella sp.]|jgi:glycosyltransferase 2 family protein|nr:lysylphosphatidylglycerol synthase transmembrane domain-containing protein [Fuerstiella sp.]